MEDITFNFSKIGEEEMHMISGGIELQDKWQRTIRAFTLNIDPEDPEYITLREAVMERFREHGFVVNTLDEFNQHSNLGAVTGSGSSSFRYLQNIYSPAAYTQQGISLAYAMTEKFLAGEGAFRVQGGGFAGTIEAYIPCDRTQEYKQYMEKLLGKACCTTLAIRNLPTMRVE